MKSRKIVLAALGIIMAAGGLILSGCKRNTARPSGEDEGGVVNIHQVAWVDVKQDAPPEPAPVAPVPKPAAETKPAPESKPAPATQPAPSSAPAAPEKANPLPAAKVASAPAPKEEPKKKPGFMAAFKKDDVLAAAEDKPKTPAPAPAKSEPAPAPAKTEPKPAEDPEAQAVKKAVINLATAIEKGDQKLFLETVAASKTETPMVMAFWKFTHSMNLLEVDLKKAYGKEAEEALAKSQQANIGFKAPSVKQLQEKLEVNVTGNNAQAFYQGSSHPLNLVKLEGAWKVKLLPEGAAQGPQATMMTGMLNVMSGAAQQAQKKVGKPGYTADKILKELAQSMMPPGLPAKMPAKMPALPKH